MFRLLLASVVAAWGAAAQTPAAPPAQPLPFSHKLHSAKGLACKECHAMPEPGDAAGIPATAKCMACHVSVAKDRPAIQKLAEFAKGQDAVPWKRVYRVPEYVSFSHKIHVTKARIECADCHGPVADRDAIAKEKPTSMAFCMDCHKARAASVACDFCHEPR